MFLFSDKNVRQSSWKLKKINYAETNNELSLDVFEDDISDIKSGMKGKVSTPTNDNNHINKSCSFPTNLSLQFQTQVSQEFITLLTSM